MKDITFIVFQFDFNGSLEKVRECSETQHFQTVEKYDGLDNYDKLY